jgi:hypothetical protein
MSRPFFSIVIPTKNRLGPLKLTLQSVLQQEFQDWECIVVDNNDDDRLEPLLAEFSDSRVTRLKTGGLHMADNWDAALRAGTGEYLMLINDKQSLYGHALFVAHRELKSHEHELLLLGSDVFNDLDPDHITVAKRAGDRQFRVLSSDDILAELTFKTKKSRKKVTGFPRRAIVCCNSIVRRSTLETIRERTGQKICLPVNPDTTMGCHLLNHLTSYLHFDGEMSFFHSMSVSTGGNIIRSKNDVNGFWASLGGEGIGCRNVPIKRVISECLYYNDYVFMRTLLGGRLARFPLSWPMYYIATNEILAKAEKEGMDRSQERAAWEKALASESAGMRLRVRMKLFGRGLTRFRRNLRAWSGLRRLETLFKKRKKVSTEAPKKILDASTFMREQTDLLRAIDCREVRSTAAPL